MAVKMSHPRGFFPRFGAAFRLVWGGLFLDNPAKAKGQIEYKGTQVGQRIHSLLLLAGLGLASGTAIGQTKEYIVRFAENKLPIVRSKPADDRIATQSRSWGYLKPTTLTEVLRLEKTLNFTVRQAYSAVLNGFSAHLTPQQVTALQQEPSVEAIEEVRPTRIAQLSLLNNLGGLTNLLGGLSLGGGQPGPAPGPDPSQGEESVSVPVLQTQPAPSGPAPEPAPQMTPYGIRVSDGVNSWTAPGDGQGSVDTPTAYVLDTGVGSSGNELNLVGHVNFFGGSNTDCNGHGTHVAGTIGARDNASDTVGMAPGVKLVGVKVLGCDGTGTTAIAIKGLDWVVANAIRPAVANISLTSSPSKMFDDAVRRVAAAGIVISVSAGNDRTDACTESPTRVGGGTEGVLVVAAHDENFAEPGFSNFGRCVDLWAPGVNVVSTRNGGGQLTLSGTSMAAPHVAGAAAVYRGRYPDASAAAVWSYLKSTAVTTSQPSKDGAKVRRLRADIQ